MFVFFMMIMSSFPCLPDKYRRQHRKNVCLQKRHQYFNEINKYGKCRLQQAMQQFLPSYSSLRK